MQNGLSGKTKNFDKIGFKVPFAISSADKDTVKILNEFQIERTWRICERNFKTYLIKIYGFAAQTVLQPMIHLSTHSRSNTISTSHYVGEGISVSRDAERFEPQNQKLR